MYLDPGTVNTLECKVEVFLRSIKGMLCGGKCVIVWLAIVQEVPFCNDRLLVATPLCKRTLTMRGHFLPTDCLYCVIARANSTYLHTNGRHNTHLRLLYKKPCYSNKGSSWAKSLATSHQVIARLAVTQPKCS